MINSMRTFLSTHHHPHQLQLIEVSEGDKIVFKCRTSTPTKPSISIRWLKNFIPININSSSINEKIIEDDDKHVFYTEVTLNLFVKLDDQNSIYSCLAAKNSHDKLLLTSTFNGTNDAAAGDEMYYVAQESVTISSSSSSSSPSLSDDSDDSLHGIFSSVILSILYPPGKPEIEGLTPGEDVLTAGDQVTLACISRGGNPSPSLIWYRSIANNNNHNNMYSESHYEYSSFPLSSTSNHNSNYITVDDSYSVIVDSASTNTYSFTVTPMDNQRIYKCEAVNSVGLSSSLIKLDVKFAPISIRINGPSIGKINEILRYECIIGPSNPAPTSVIWLINGIAQSNGVYPIESWIENVSYGIMIRTNITVLLSESIKTISCSASSSMSSSSISDVVSRDVVDNVATLSTTEASSSYSSSSSSTSNDLTTIQASINVHVLCKYT